MPADSAFLPSRRSWQAWTTLAARLILGITLLVAGGLKLPNLEESVFAVRAYQLLPFEVTRPIGYALPIIEVALGLMLVTGTFTRLAAVAGAAMMAIFVAGIASVWARGISIDCGCFGGGGAVDNGFALYPWEIARDVGLLLAGAWAAWRPTSLLAVDRWLLGPTATERMPDLIPQTEESV